MKKKWNLLYVALATVLLLAACGTSDTDNEAKDNEVNGTASEGASTDDSVVEEDIDEEVDSEKEEEESSEPVTETETEKEDSTESTNNNDNLLSDAIQTKSDEQDYSIQLLPTYKLTSEEPGRDSLYVKDNDSVFMRIETMDEEEGNYEYAVENTIVVLEASSGGAVPDKLVDTELPKGDGIEDAEGYFVTAESAPVTGIVFKKDGMVIKLTIFDTPNADHIEEFLRMAETILKNS
ncbi:hypothetical protein ACFSFY_13525 [Sporosarcina siberiensis]|uniref:Lipoprotein n=1 Tax=Sporosarcina siberiensis TaxID=1365606 RepID=A0ABW4SHR7_9BACL